MLFNNRLIIYIIDILNKEIKYNRIIISIFVIIIIDLL